VYGLVNQAMQDLVLGRHGRATWAAIMKRADVDIDPFVAMSPYPDDVTYRLVTAAAEHLDRPVDDVLVEFGEYWIDHAAEHGYAELLDLMGDDLPAFLHGLDAMHDRLRLTFPGLDPPSIWCTDVTPASLVVHYVSDRPGLTPFMTGLLRGTARRFGEHVVVEPRRRRDEGHPHDEFLVHRRADA